MADAMFEPADFLEESLAWAARVVTGDDHGRIAAEVDRSDGAWAAAVARGRAIADAAHARLRAGARTGRWS